MIDLNNMTTQEVFSAACVYFRAQRHQICLYRTTRGGRCVIGAFMPDYAYVETMENKFIGKVIERYNDIDIWANIGFTRHKDLLQKLQFFNDNVANWHWGEKSDINEYCLQNFAKINDLIYTPSA